MKSVVSFLLPDPRDAMKFIGMMKSKCQDNLFRLKVDETIAFAELYRANNDTLKTELDNIALKNKNLPLYKKIWRKISPPLIDYQTELEKEIAYRKQNPRNPDDWKEPFIETAKFLRREGLVEEADYIEKKGMMIYAQARNISLINS